MQNSKCKKCKKMNKENIIVRMLCFQPNPNISWQLNPKTLTRVRGQTLPDFQIIIIIIIIKNWFSYLVLNRSENW